MTNKELLYLEDALNANTLLKQKCSNYTNQVQDRELKAYFNQLSTKSQDMFTELMKGFN